MTELERMKVTVKEIAKLRAKVTGKHVIQVIREMQGELDELNLANKNRKKLGNLTSGIDTEIMQAGITLAGYHIESGTSKFVAFTKAMVNDLGEVIKPYLKSFYNAVRDWPGFNAQGMDSYKAVEKADVNAILSTSEKKTSDSLANLTSPPMEAKETKQKFYTDDWARTRVNWMVDYQPQELVMLHLTDQLLPHLAELVEKAIKRWYRLTLEMIEEEATDRIMMEDIQPQKTKPDRNRPNIPKKIMDEIYASLKT